jgi:hypothetical protein
MVHEVLIPADLLVHEGMVPVRDPTAPEGLEFVHGDAAKPLATPWQVALERALLMDGDRLPVGPVLDPACGSGVQLAALAVALGRPALGVEMDRSRALASAHNLARVAAWYGEEDEAWFRESRVVVGDGTEAAVVLAASGHTSVGVLQLDPARPRNSRTHDLEEMAPSPKAIMAAWVPHLAHGPEGPALLLDLSPRLVHEQRLGMEAIVDAHLPGCPRTWVWGSRGGGRVDRLSLWLGGCATANVARRFLRYPPDGGVPLLFEGGRAVSLGEDLPEATRRPPVRGEHVTLIDAALLSSGLAESWLRHHLGAEVNLHWGAVDGRRPRVHHAGPLALSEDEVGLVQATGRLVAVVQKAPSEATVDDLVALALEHDVARLTLRCSLPDDLQPRLQGSLDRQLQRRHGRRQAFLCEAGLGPDVHLLCVGPVPRDGADS